MLFFLLTRSSRPFLFFFQFGFDSNVFVPSLAFPFQATVLYFSKMFLAHVNRSLHLISFSSFDPWFLLILDVFFVLLLTVLTFLSCVHLLKLGLRHLCFPFFDLFLSFLVLLFVFSLLAVLAVLAVVLIAVAAVPVVAVENHEAFVLSWFSFQVDVFSDSSLDLLGVFVRMF